MRRIILAIMAIFIVVSGGLFPSVHAYSPAYTHYQAISYLYSYPKWAVIELPGYSSTRDERMNWEVDPSMLDAVRDFKLQLGNRSLFLFASANFLGDATFNEAISILKPDWILVIPSPYNDSTVISAVDSAKYLLNMTSVGIWFQVDKLQNATYVADYIRSAGMVLSVDQPYLAESTYYLSNYPVGIEIYQSEYLKYANCSPKYIVTGTSDSEVLVERLSTLSPTSDIYIFAAYTREPFLTLWDILGYNVTHDNFDSSSFSLSTYDQLAIQLLHKRYEFEVSSGYIQYTVFGGSGSSHLVSPDDACSDCALFLPFDDLDTGSNTTTVYTDGQASTASVYFNSTTSYPRLISGKVGNALEFDGSRGSYVRIPENIDITTITSLSFGLWVSPNVTSSWQRILWTTYGVFEVKVDPSGKVYIGMADNSWNYPNWETGITSDGEWHYLVAIFQWNSTETTVRVFVDGDEKHTYFYSGIPLQTEISELRIGEDAYGSAFKGKVDEFRLYVNKTLSYENILLRVYLGRYRIATDSDGVYKVANLSISSVILSEGGFLVNVSAVLPEDGQSYLLPVPADASSEYTSVGGTGDFKFLNVGNSGTVWYTLAVPENLSLPAGLDFLAWPYDRRVYIVRQSKTVPSAVSVFSPDGGVWELEAGGDITNTIFQNYTKVEVVNFTGSAHIEKVLNFAVEPQGVGYVNISLIKHSPSTVEFTASAPAMGQVVFTLGGLRPEYRYILYIDGDRIRTLETNTSGWLTFSWSNWSTHTVTLEAYAPGDEWFYDTINLVAALFAVFIAVPLIGLGYIVYLANKGFREGRIQGDVHNTIVAYGKLFLALGLIGLVMLIVLAYLSSILW